jgi:hypothetical protein
MRAVLSLVDHGPRRAFRQLRRVAIWFAAWVALFGGAQATLPALAGAQVFVLPRRPSQTNVRYADFDWRYADILVGERIERQLEWPEGPRFHAGAFRLPGLGTPWSVPNTTQAPLTYQRASGDETPEEARQQSRERAERERARRAGGAGDEVTRELLSAAGGIRIYFYERERPIAERGRGPPRGRLA